MQSRDKGIIRPEFFTLPTETKREEDQIDFPVPPSAEALPDFLAGSEGQAYRQGTRALMKALRRWIAETGAVGTKNLDHFIQKYIHYSGKDRGENIIMLPLLQEGFSLLQKILNLLKHYPIEVVPHGKPKAETMQLDKIYLYAEQNELHYAVKRRRKGVKWYPLPAAELGRAVHQDILDTLQSGEEPLSDTQQHAIYKLTEKNGHYRAPNERQLEKQKDKIKNLVNSMDVCAPGCHTHLHDTHLALSAELDMQLMEFRLSTLQQIVQEAMKPFEKKFYKGNHIHYVNTILEKHQTFLGIEVTRDTFHTVCKPGMLAQIERQLFKNLLIPLSAKPDYADIMENEKVQMSRAGMSEEAIKFLSPDVCSLTLNFFEEYAKPAELPVEAKKLPTVSQQDVRRTFERGFTGKLLRLEFTLDALMRYANNRCDLPYFQRRLLSKACTITILDVLSDDRKELKRQYAGAYLLLDPALTGPALYRVGYDGAPERISLTDATLFRRGIEHKINKQAKTLHLSAEDADKYITQNGGYRIRPPRALINDAINTILDEIAQFGEDDLFDLGSLLDTDELLFEKYVFRPDAEFNLKISLLKRLAKAGVVDLHALYGNAITLGARTTCYLSENLSADYDYVTFPSPDNLAIPVRQSYIAYAWEQIIGRDVQSAILKSFTGVKVGRLMKGFLKYVQAKISVCADAGDPELMNDVVEEVQRFLAHQTVRKWIETRKDGVEWCLAMITACPDKYHPQFMPGSDTLLALIKKVDISSAGIIDKLAKLSVVTHLHDIGKTKESKAEESKNDQKALFVELFWRSQGKLLSAMNSHFTLAEIDAGLCLLWKSLMLSAMPLLLDRLTILLPHSPASIIQQFMTAENPLSTIMIEKALASHSNNMTSILEKVSPQVLRPFVLQAVKGHLTLPPWQIAAMASYLPLDSDREQVRKQLHTLSTLHSLSTGMPDKFALVRLDPKAQRFEKAMQEAKSALVFKDIMQLASLLEVHDEPVRLFQFFAASEAHTVFRTEMPKSLDRRKYLLNYFLQALSVSEEKAVTLLVFTCYLFSKDKKATLLNDLQNQMPLYIIFALMLLHEDKQLVLNHEESLRFADYMDKSITQLRVYINSMPVDSATHCRMLLRSYGFTVTVLGLLQLPDFNRLIRIIGWDVLSGDRIKLARELSKLRTEHYQALAAFVYEPFTLYSFAEINFSANPDINVARLLLAIPAERVRLKIDMLLALKYNKEQTFPIHPVEKLLIASRYSEFRDVLSHLGMEGVRRLLSVEEDRDPNVFGKLRVTADDYHKHLKPPLPYERNLQLLFRTAPLPERDAFAKLMLPKMLLANQSPQEEKREEKPDVATPKTQLNDILLKQIVLHASPGVIQEWLTPAALCLLADVLPSAEFRQVTDSLKADTLMTLLPETGETLLSLTANGVTNLCGLMTSVMLVNTLSNLQTNPFIQLYQGRKSPQDFEASIQILTQSLPGRTNWQWMAEAVIDIPDLQHYASVKALKAAQRLNPAVFADQSRALVLGHLANNEDAILLILQRYDYELMENVLDNRFLEQFIGHTNPTVLPALIEKASPQQLMSALAIDRHGDKKTGVSLGTLCRMPLETFRAFINKLPVSDYVRYLDKLSRSGELAQLTAAHVAHLTILIEKAPFRFPLMPVLFSAPELQERIHHYGHLLLRTADFTITPKSESAYRAFLKNALPENLLQIMDHDRWLDHLKMQIKAFEKKPEMTDFLHLMIWRVSLSHALQHPDVKEALTEAYRAILNIRDPDQLESRQCMLISDFLWMHPFTPDHQTLALKFLHIAAAKGDEIAIQKLHQQIESKTTDHDEIDEFHYRLTLLGTQKNQSVATAERDLRRQMDALSQITTPTAGLTLFGQQRDQINTGIAAILSACTASAWHDAKTHLLTLKQKTMGDSKFKHLLGELYHTVTLLSELEKTEAKAEGTIDMLHVGYAKTQAALAAHLETLPPDTTQRLQVQAYHNLIAESRLGVEKKIAVYALLTSDVPQALRETISKCMGYRNEKAAIKTLAEALQEEGSVVGLKLDDILSRVIKPLTQQIRRNPQDINACFALYGPLTAPAVVTSANRNKLPGG